MKRRGLLLFSLLSVLPLALSGAGSNADSAVAVESQATVAMIESARTAKGLGEYDRAAGILREALKESKQKGRSDLEALCLLNLGITLWDLGEMRDAANALAEALPLFKEIGDAKNAEICAAGLEIGRDYGLGKESRTANRLKESLGHFDKAIAMGRSIRIVDFELKCLRQKSLTYWDLGDFESFHYCNERGLEIARKINHRKEVARCLNNIGAYYIKASDFTSALRTCRTALPIIQAVTELSEEAICLNNLAVIYKQLGELDFAIRNMKRAMELDVQIGDRLQISKDKVSLGGLLLRRGYISQNMEDVRSGKLKLEESLNAQGVELSPDYRVIALSNLGYAYLLISQYDLAIQLFKKALNEINFEMMQEEYGHILNNIGNAYLAKGHIEEAERYFTKSSDLFVASNFQEVIWEGYYGLGCCNEARGDLNGALVFYEKSIEAVERVRKRISIDIFKMGFAHNKMVVYDRAMNLFCGLYQNARSDVRKEELYQMMERAKAQALFESLNGVDIQHESLAEPETTALERILSREIAALNIKLASPKTEGTTRKALLCELEDKEQAYMRLISDIKSRDYSAEKARSFRIPSISEIQTLLVKDKSAILEYFVSEKRSYLVVITHDNSELYFLPGQAELETSLRGYLKCLSSPSGGQFEGMHAAERIAGELLMPLSQEKYSQIDTLIIVPDGLLQYLPFETLRVADRTDHYFLLEKFNISYAPSISTLLFLKGRMRRFQLPKDFLAFGAPERPDLRQLGEIGNGSDDQFRGSFYISRGLALSPLPFSKAEIRKAAELFPAHRRSIFLGNQASEAALKKMPLCDYRIVHFACHAISDDLFPFRSALVLSPGNTQEEDGFLQVRELYNLKLNAELAVLSACQTANGSLEQGEGIVGLTRGFFQAGARSIVSSLWSVNDRSTAEFMEDFYNALVRGEDKSSALRAAKLKMLKSSHAHPYYWAAFILSGDPGPVWQGGQKSNMPN